MTINWKAFLKSDYWFAVDRAGLHKADYYIGYIAAGLIVLAIALLIYRRFAKNQFIKKVAGQFTTIFMTIGLAEAIWFGMRYENAIVLGTKITAVIIALVGLIWAVLGPLNYLARRYRTDMAEAQRQMLKEKYLQR